ncbi:PREDICTED: rab3 GTPase-activating protein catalytic subunit-like isoform X4 [Nicotiana attenuata]|uniref:rab3 GTPase-activating protein catalytic subunit-like isoform X4 n=1 Tax=Nicotiana attenuata TaxID=49451 RepID=UPI000904C055|nr:PREDICTED: rab3 GTPase-activating protein catalytic subunit-like isoform X4 [Nicotiana attenuata]
MASISKIPSSATDEDLEEEIEHFDDFTLASSWERFISEIEAVCRQWLADGTKNLLVIAPQSASGVVLDGPEASKLLSAVAISLSNCSCLWPAFVPVHVPSRKAYIGIQNMGTLYTRRFEADRIGSQVPLKLMHLEGLYELFVSKFAFSNMDLSMHLFQVNLKMKLTYRTLPYDEDFDVQEPEGGITEPGGSPKSKYHNRKPWDDDCPWSEWYSAEDPVKGFELLTVWSEKAIGSSLEMAELENASPLEAEKWSISPCLSEILSADSDGKRIGFASQLQLLIDALHMSLETQFVEDFVSVEHSRPENLKSTAVIPPPTVLDRVLKDLFYEVEAAQPDYAEGDHKNSRTIKGAPLESLFGQFCLHALWVGDCNIRAIAAFWIEFVREVRWCWEESQPLPRMPANGVIDLSTCLINQKLHMLAICMDRKHQFNQKGPKADENGVFLSARIKADTEVQSVISSQDGDAQASCWECDSLSTPDQDPASHISSFEHSGAVKLGDPEHSACIRRGSAGVVGSMMLLKSYQNMHAPFTQDSPLMTEDMHEERLQAIEALGDSSRFSAQLEKDILSSDMSAFKAANPDAVFEDFIRWHSPRDWENDDNMEKGVSQINAVVESIYDWPPRGKLSERMSEHGNLWRKIWNEAPPLPASEQKPLLDPNQEGEKVLHYLETLRPYQLLEQMVSTAFRATADTLNKTSFGGLKQMTTRIEQLYLTMSTTLRCLQTNSLSVDAEDIKDLKRLCTTFAHVENVITLAASLHRKFMQAPRLSESIFNDYDNFHVPKLGTFSIGHDVKKVFNNEQEVRQGEREVIASMFTPPTANQSWRKVLSMGNLLNGHEPASREIIFTKRDHLCENYYVGHAPKGYQQEFETYRMYVCGTSNDLGVALAVTSCD